jgi:hypothetical protein
LKEYYIERSVKYRWEATVIIIKYIHIFVSGDRIPVGARFFAPVLIGPGDLPAFCTVRNESIPRVKRPGRGADNPHPYSADVKKE